ncbi:MAG: hypothetical protein ACRDJH_18695 [Thermomicrobiales bacterium]
MDEILSEIFSSRVRAAVLGHLLPRPHRAFSLTDLSRLLGLPISSLQHECYKLQRIGVLTGRRVRNAYLYRPDPSCPVHQTLTRLVVVGLGEATALRAGLEGVPGLELAFLGRSLPLNGVTSRAPAPLVLVGDVPLEEIDAAQWRAATLLGLPLDAVEAVYYRPVDWTARVQQGSAYVASLLHGPRTHLVGDDATVR